MGGMISRHLLTSSGGVRHPMTVLRSTGDWFLNSAIPLALVCLISSLAGCSGDHHSRGEDFVLRIEPQKERYQQGEDVSVDLLIYNLRPQSVLLEETNGFFKVELYGLASAGEKTLGGRLIRLLRGERRFVLLSPSTKEGIGPPFVHRLNLGTIDYVGAIRIDVLPSVSYVLWGETTEGLIDKRVSAVLDITTTGDSVPTPVGDHRPAPNNP